MNDEAANPKQLAIPASRVNVDVAVLLAAILATHFVTGGFRLGPISWLYLPAWAAMGWALSLHFGPTLPSRPSSTVRTFIRGHMVFILAFSILIVGARLGFRFQPNSDAPNNLMHGKLREMLLWLGSIVTVTALFIPILSRPARLSPVFWLVIAQTLVLVSTTASRYTPFF